MEDDVYDGMNLKKGATVLPNTFGCLRDPVDYPDPEEFKPERFLEVVPGSGGKRMRIRKDVPDPRGMAFGYGRR
jgi:cytochrome P450